MSGLMTWALLKMGKTAMLEGDGMTLLAADGFRNAIVSMVSMSYVLWDDVLVSMNGLPSVWDREQ